MLILTIRTDNPQAEVGLFDGPKELAYEAWHAHRELSVTLHRKIGDLLRQQKVTWQDIEGVVCFQGPGSFTGLRIGLTVANALAAGLAIPVVATQGEQWLQTGLTRLAAGLTDTLALPFYGADARITQQRK